MSDSRQDLRDKLRQTGCEVIIPQAVVPVIPTRPTIPCDPITGEPLPNTFVTPGGVIPIDELPPILDLIPIGNDTQTKTCADLPDKTLAYPDTKSVAANTVELTFSWYDITPPITDAQIFYIASLYADLPGLRAQLINTSSTAVADLVAYTKLTDQQAASANELAKSVKASANDQAAQLALLQLVCGWYNETQTVNCPATALTTGAITGVDSLNPSVITAGTVFSTESLGTANTNAYALATAALKCVYGNDEQTQSCADIFPTEPPVDSLPAESTNTKTANTYFSTVSKAEANALAIAAAREALNCYWKNNAQEIVCEPDADNIPAILSDTPIYDPNSSQLSADYPDGLFPQGNVADGTVGNKVVVAADLFASNTSFADAQFLAESAGANLLLCRWGNDVVKAQCPIVEIDDPNRKGLLDNTQLPPSVYKVKVLPNLALSQPTVVVNDFFRAKSLTTITAALGVRSFTITAWNPSINVQFALGDLVSIKPLNTTNDVIQGLTLTGEITVYSGVSLTVNVLQVTGNAVAVLGNSTWNKWQITLSQGSVIIDNSILSDVSKDDANIIAQSIVDSSLRCVYCNVQVDPRCLPLQLEKNYNGELVEYDPADIPNPTGTTIWDSLPWNEVGGNRVPTLLNLIWQVDTAGVPLVDEYGFRKPVYQGNTVIDPGLIKDPQFSWSDDATLGVAAGKFCGESVPVVTEIADNQLPISFYKEVEDACVYCNDPVGADCVNGALIRKEDPLDGSIFLPARTVCVASAPTSYERKKYVIADSVTVAGTQNSSGLFSQTPVLTFTFSNTINLAALGVAVGDFLRIVGSTNTSFPITGVNSTTQTLTLSNPSGASIPIVNTQVYVDKILKGTFSNVGGVITVTVTTPGFSAGNYDFTLNADYIKLAGTTDTFVINGKANPNIFNVLNLGGYSIPSGEQTIELWKKDTTNQSLAKQYATDSALDLAASLLQCISFNFACSSQVTRTCANIGKGTPADKLDPTGPTTITLPRCLISSTEESASELTAQAIALADKMLNCQFFNETLILPCGPGGSGGRWLVNVGGNVPQRTFLEDSYSSAKQKAVTLVEKIANSGACIWTNNEIIVTCNDTGTPCPSANRCAPTTLTVPTGTFIHVVNDLLYSGNTPQLPDLDAKAREYAKSILLPICSICGNNPVPKTQLVCGAGQTPINFNKNVGANLFCAGSQGAANAAAQLMANGNQTCLPEFATKDYVDQEITRKICIGINYVEDPVNERFGQVNDMRASIQSHLNTLAAKIDELNSTINGLYVECVDGNPELKGNDSAVTGGSFTVTPSIEALNITCPP